MNIQSLFIIQDDYEHFPARPSIGKHAITFKDTIRDLENTAKCIVLHNKRRTQVLKELKSLNNGVESDDLVLLYISAYLAIDDDQLYLLVQDSESDAIEFSSINLTQIIHRLNNLSCKYQCIILDCTLPADNSRAEIISHLDQFALSPSTTVERRLLIWDGGIRVDDNSYLTYYMGHSLKEFPESIEGLVTFRALLDYVEASLLENNQTQSVWYAEYNNTKKFSLITSEIKSIKPEESRIFFSYKREDEAIVRRFYDEMLSRGAQPIWLDRERLKPGDDWSGEITRALDNCTVLVLFVSKATLFSYVIAEDEVTYFESLHTEERPRRIIPVLLEPDVMSTNSHTDNAQYHKGDARLIQACETLKEVINRINWLSTTPFSEDPEGTFLTLSTNLPKVPFQLPKLLKVEAGEFWMGERGREKRVYLDEFWISEWPVTVREFAHFVNANGLHSTDLFPEAFRQELFRSHRTRQDWYTDDTGALEQYAQEYPQMPMTGLTWLQAYAYCNWLNRVSGLPDFFRIPTSAQWEKAARGADGFRFPWGNTWQDGIANTKEAGHGQILPCGMMGEAGNSPYGCQDMAGNIWEWTLSAPFDVDEDDLLREELPRIIRGGDFKSDQSMTWTYSIVSELMRPQYYGSTLGIRLISHHNYPTKQEDK